MTSKPLLPLMLLPALSGLLSGCAGHNTVMFMTKSNAGLDIDAKPPTAEINISRKEVVIEPVFESGRTPPVMASFKPDAHFGGVLGNFFLGVDQTFAGGDAAKAMAMLYDLPTARLQSDETFDSTLTLEKPLPAGSPRAQPAPPGTFRPFIFGTDTSLGLKVAWSGMGGQFPDTVKAGFNRKEFAWAPLTMSADRKSVKIPSFIATIESHAGGGAERDAPHGTNGVSRKGGIQAIQYFATGEAATHLARQRDVRVAMLRRLDPEFTPDERIEDPSVVRHLLGGMRQTFDDLMARDDVARAHRENLRNLEGIEIPETFESLQPAMFYHAWIPESGTNAAVLRRFTARDIHQQAETIPAAAAYLSLLEQSTQALELATQALARNSESVRLSIDAGAPHPVTPAQAVEIQKQIALQQHRMVEFQDALCRHPEILAALDYYRRLTR